MKTQVAKKIIGQFAGDAMQGYFKGLFGAAGRAGKAATQGALNYGRSVVAPGATTSQIPRLLRAGANSPLPQLGYYGGQAALAGGIFAAANAMDQQSDHSQPMPGGTGNAEMDKFIMQQKLNQQKFEHELRLTYAREEARIPGKQIDTQAAMYKGGGGSGRGLDGFNMRSDVLRDAAEAERLYTDAGEITNREVQGIGRMIYGTGLRA